MSLKAKLYKLMLFEVLKAWGKCAVVSGNGILTLWLLNQSFSSRASCEVLSNHLGIPQEEVYSVAGWPTGY